MKISPNRLLALTLLLPLSGIHSPARSADAHSVMNAPDQFAWGLFVDINKPADATKPNGPVIWETWALARDVFRNPNAKPEWPAAEADAPRQFEPAPLQQLIRASQKAAEVPTPGPAILVDSGVLLTEGNETRMNRDAFDFVVANELYHIEGQEAFFNSGRTITFPVGAQEIKAQWRRIAPEQKARYHWTEISRSGAAEPELWGLTALHITTKDIPNWFWATWEHKDNEGVEAVVPSRDKAGLPAALQGTKWENYLLRGTQVDFVSATGKPIILANSQVERGFQATSSCMTCHSRASIGDTPRTEFDRGTTPPTPLPRPANRLAVFENDGENGAVGVPLASWFEDATTDPPSRSYIQTDFVWSLFRARRKSVPPLPNAIQPVDAPATGAAVASAIPAAPSLAIPPPKLLVRLAKDRRLPEKLRPWLTPLGLQQEAGFATSRLLMLDSPAALDVHGLQDFIVVRPPSLGVPAGSLHVKNLDAAKSHLVPQLRGTFGLNGSGMTVAVFDEGGVRPSHLEFRRVSNDPASTRVTLSTNKPFSEHSTHVAGTVAANGRNPQAIGMAPGSLVRSFDWDNDLEELAAVADSIVISNHSYGKNTGWTYTPQLAGWAWWGHRGVSQTKDWGFGAYTLETAELDSLLHRTPHLVTVVAAGNDRNDVPPLGSALYEVLWDEHGIPTRYQLITGSAPPADNADQGGLDTISGFAVSKNALAVGSIEDITPQNDLSINMTEYSSWGPTDDFRVKPDVVANGDWLLSTSPASDQAYVSLPGTSMASPTCAGICVLLIEHWRKVKGQAPLASDIKALLIHVARDAGTPGPDPIFGWGSLDAMKAGEVLADENGRAAWTADVGPTGQTFNMVGTGSAVRVTVVWTDPGGRGIDRIVDERTPVLVNDIDCTLISPAGTAFHPWALDRANLLGGARRDGPNRVDNVEVIDAPAVSGSWTLSLKPHRLAEGASQRVSVIVSGLR